MNIQKIGKLIAACRKEKGMTQAQLAEKLGVTNKTVSQWENGNYMPDLTSESTMRGDDVPDINIAEIFNIISEEFSVLGNAEGYQVYSNLTGKNKRNLQPFGCFRMSNWYLVSQTVPLPANN